jgi:hypothetical protein
MKEFLRKNKALFRLLVGAAAFFGMADWDHVQSLGAHFNSSLGLSENVFSSSWWLGSALGVRGARIFLAAVIFGTVTNAIFSFRTRNKPISILCTDIVLKFTKGGSRAVISRKQVLHANRPDITAYFMQISLDSSTARFEQDQTSKSEVAAWLDHPPKLAIQPKTIGRGKVRDVNLCYAPALPYSWILSILPRWTLEWGPSKLPNFVGRYLVIQHVTYTSLNEYDNDDAIYQATSTRYLHNRISITLDFSEDTGPCPKAAADICVVRRISNAVSDENAIPTDDAGVYKINIGSGMAKDETIVVTWKRH